ncbi:Re/Si-specific NAD(P)(+) transhydrogenase subunit alpha [Salinibius halmophilus]|uniref:Re/Si-specific NAD(P)(+) transhydrogenase subunit alpha n=1 Tax=Salinibius halmophilus TaxID=1853216 RepID=UPI000E66780E|nr:Re/Si-specific NAD(P)(+) transhydrogenase subunit alpha [Salinibius halmophilus]
MPFQVVIPRETVAGETRVAATPDSVKKLIKLGYTVAVQSNAGQHANFADEDYTSAGAEVIADTAELLAKAGIVLKVATPTDAEIDLIPSGAILISYIWPAQNEALLKKLAERGINTLGMESIPRLSRAQKMDALSSMSNISGYRAVIEAANHFGRFFTGQITAAGKVPPAKVMIVGAGVAGLAAIGTAKGLGAIVRAFDTRLAAKEQVESMGAEFLELEFEEDGSGEGGYAKVMSDEFIKAEMELFRQQAEEVDIIITTALIPGRPAPKLILEEVVKTLKPGSVIVDLAAEQGGNCECTVPGEVVTKHGVTIVGLTNLATHAPAQASQLYSQNLVHLLTDLTPEKDGEPFINMDDEVLRGATVVKDGEITFPPPPLKSQQDASAKKSAPAPEAPVKPEKKPMSGKAIAGFWAIAFAAMLGLGQVSSPEFVQHFVVFVLSIFIGWQVIWNVSHALHTPLMAVTNAISGIVILGTLLQLGGVGGSGLILALAFIGTLVAMINVVGGFYVTHRMLAMFRKD